MELSVSDVAAMYSLLANSMSADHRLRGPAEEALAQSESRRGFCSCLLVLFFISLRVPMNFALCFFCFVIELLLLENGTAGSDYC
jgi:hypothetical protein